MAIDFANAAEIAQLWRDKTKLREDMKAAYAELHARQLQINDLTVKLRSANERLKAANTALERAGFKTQMPIEEP
jgi:predicted  nucleic acid-binding Zn-ribbon protein